jgi:hypothetical protein
MLVAVGVQAQSARGVIQIRESVFDDLARRLASPPIVVSRRVAPVDLPWCNEIAELTLLQLDSRIRSGGVTVTADGVATWCNLGGSFKFSAPIGVSYDQNARNLRLAIQPGTATVTVHIPEWLLAIAWMHAIPIPPKIERDVSVDLSGYLGTLPPLPLDATQFTVETARGSRSFMLVARNVQISHHYRYIELSGNIAIQ